MKKPSLLRKSAVTLAPRFRFKRNISLLFAFAAFSLTSCEEHGCDDAPKPAGNCSSMATVEDDACKTGPLGSKWLRLSNGDLLMPQKSTVDISNLVHGDQVKLGYKVLENNPESTLICNYVQAPEQADFGIAITCLESVGRCGTPLPSGNCNTYATAYNVCGAGVWGGNWLKLDDGSYLQPYESNVSVSALVPGKRYKLGYEPMNRDNRYLQAVICQAVPPVSTAVRILCLEPDSSTTATKK